MNGAATTVGSVRDNSYVSEVRFGIVMYGGVSLAIYINGVANELYEMACATPKAVNTAGANGTREVYRKASFLLGSEELRRRYAEHLDHPETIPDPLGDDALMAGGPRTRFVVDVISGTSAGGINGAFLAKALANGQEFSPLKSLWIQEGNIESLLNDDTSYRGLEYAKGDSAPRSLLNSDRMYIKLLDAFEGMRTMLPPIGESESPLVDELDLYITTTDIRGAVVPLRLFDDVVYEKRYKQVYHFQYAAANGLASSTDFIDNNAPFLAFAARCTSSFPFAFEPMTVADAERLWKARPGSEPLDVSKWKPFFTGLSSDDISKDRWRSRAFGDGGYLDNKPFSYVVDALSWRLGALPMERKLIYVEPAPAHPEKERQDYSEKPDAIENAFKALNTIPQYETTREDLEAVLARNRRIERVERIVRQVEADIETRRADPFNRLKLIEGEVPKWASLDLGAMIEYYGVAFLPYRRLRIAAVTDDIAERLAIRWDVDRRSDRFYALKALARVWREGNYYEHESEKSSTRPESINQFLYEYDVKYRLRRAGFLLRKVHQLRSLAINWKQGKDRQSWSDVERRLWDRLDSRGCPLSSMKHEALVVALNCLAGGFGQSLQELRGAVWPAPLGPAEQPSAAARATLDQLLRLLLDEKLVPPLRVLYTSDKRPVEVAIDELPPPNRLRTLQENIFARAQALFGLAKVAHAQTEIQDLLENDLVALQKNYQRVILSGQGTTLARDLLGDPKLVPSRAAATDDGSQAQVVIQVKETVGFCDGALDTPEGKIVREFLAEYYLRFDEYDQMSFPLYYDTGTGEPSTVEVLRVSPEDACNLIDERNDCDDNGRPRRKLAGTALFNFGAFLDVRWRRNDIMWGRLDGCERLLAALFPAAADKAIRQSLLEEAQRTILREEMQPEGYGLLVDRFAAALAEQKEATLKAAFESLWAHLAPADDDQRSTRTAQALKAVLGDAGMLEYVRRYYKVNRELDTASTMKTGARALTITGRILEGSEKRYRAAGSRMVWVTRGGRALQVLLSISTPGSPSRAMLRHWLGLLYVFEILIVLGALAFSAPAARTFGVTCLVVTIALHAASLVAGDLMHRRWRWVRLIAFLVGITVFVLTLLGAVALSNVGLKSIMCTGGQDSALVFQKLCP